jgi:hypothetical protein
MAVRLSVISGEDIIRNIGMKQFKPAPPEDKNAIEGLAKPSIADCFFQAAASSPT